MKTSIGNFEVNWPLKKTKRHHDKKLNLLLASKIMQKFSKDKKANLESILLIAFGSFEPTMYYNFWASLLHIHLWLSVLRCFRALWILAIKECKEAILENISEFCFIFSYMYQKGIILRTYTYLHWSRPTCIINYPLSIPSLKNSEAVCVFQKGIDSFYIKILRLEVKSETPTAYEIFKNWQGILVGKIDGFS